MASPFPESAKLLAKVGDLARALTADIHVQQYQADLEATLKAAGHPPREDLVGHAAIKAMPPSASRAGRPDSRIHTGLHQGR